MIVAKGSHLVVPVWKEFKYSSSVKGIVRYFGPARLLNNQMEVWVGLELDSFPLSAPSCFPPTVLCLGDGAVGGIRYFTCLPGLALFIRRSELEAPNVVRIQCWIRQLQAKKRVRALVGSHAWNVLDTHLEELGLQRGMAVIRVQQEFTIPAPLSGSSSEEELVERVMRLAEREVQDLTLESLASIRVVKEYDGPHLRFPLTLESVKALLEDFKSKPDQILHYRYLMSLFLLAKSVFGSEPNVQEIQFSSPSQTLTVVGDTHGQLDDLLTIFSIQGVPSPNNMYLFNGDFVDRGAKGVEILVILFAFKILYPNAVFLNRGNHEARAQNAWMGFEEEILAKYTSPHITVKNDRRAALRVHLLCEQLFDCLPLCAVVHQKVFICHGGLFRNDGVTLNHLRHLNRKREPPLNGRSFEDRVFEDLLWSDPRPSPHYPRALQGRRASDRGAGCEFGSVITSQFCKTNKIALVVRSHECVPEGFEVLHGGRLITIFSASRYCGTQTNKGAYIVFKQDLQPNVMQFFAQNVKSTFITEDERTQALEADAIQMMIEQIVDRKLDLFWFFTKNDPLQSGEVTRDAWAHALTNVLGLDLPYLYYQRFIAQVEENGKINYSRFLSRFKVRSSIEGEDELILSKVCATLQSSSLEEVWFYFAGNRQAPSVAYSQFCEKLMHLNSGLTDIQIFDLMSSLDQESEGQVSFQGFSHRFGPYLRKAREPIDEDVANVLFQLRTHVRAAFRNVSQTQERVSLKDFHAGMTAFNISMNKPLTEDQIQHLSYALQDQDGLVSYCDFFDSLSIVDSNMEHTSSFRLIRKSSSFYFQQLERNERQDKLVQSKRAHQQRRFSTPSSDEEEEILTGMDDY